MINSRSPLLAAIAIASLISGCFREVKTARVRYDEPLSPVEQEARVRLTHPRCGRYMGLLFPGLTQMCNNDDGKALLLAGVGAVELGATIAAAVSVDDAEHPAIAVPFLMFSNTYTYGVAHGLIDRSIAAAQPFAPQDSLGDLLAAPFNLEVMKRPRVWAGLILSLAAGIGLSLALTDDEDIEPGGRPNVFGREFAPGIGYPLAGATGIAMFSHVAIGEETLFRGLLQSGFARSSGEIGGWLGASAIFGLAHAPNAFALEGKQRTQYLLYAVPYLTVIGAYLGWVYKEEGYSLAPPVATHFWYDLVLSSVFFALNPKDNTLSATFTLPF